MFKRASRQTHDMLSRIAVFPLTHTHTLSLSLSHPERRFGTATEGMKSAPNTVSPDIIASHAGVRGAWPIEPTHVVLCIVRGSVDLSYCYLSLLSLVAFTLISPQILCAY
jgi:hypothetical protein